MMIDSIVLRKLSVCRSFALKALVMLAMFQLHVVAAKKTNPYFSQFDQDRYLHHLFFKEKREGVFVELGAYDGVTGSNTLFFEKQLVWSGVCIEPLPQIFTVLKRRRSCICANVAIADFEGAADFVVSSVLSGMPDKMDQRHIDRIHALKGKKDTIRVTCCRFNNLMAQHDINHIDYLSLDIEGAEMDVLRTMDFEVITIDVLSVEGNYSDQSAAIRSYLAQKGYIFVRRLAVDDIFCRKGFAEIYSAQDVADLEERAGINILSPFPEPCYLDTSTSALAYR